MKKIEIETRVVNGKFTDRKQMIIKAVQQFEGKNVIFSIRKKTKKRSNQQNNYYWGVIIPLATKAILDTWGEIWNKERVHELLLAECPIYTEKVNKDTGEIMRVVMRSSEMNTIEMNNYWTACGRLLHEYFNVYVPEPNEILKLEI